MPQHRATEIAHITRDHGGSSRRFTIRCPTCQAPLDTGLTLPELRQRHQVRPGDILTADCGHTYRLPQPFPAV
ncbi:MAG: hypothetical protein AB7R89_07915 [Dehalococcoidia bacterium]